MQIWIVQFIVSSLWCDIDVCIDRWTSWWDIWWLLCGGLCWQVLLYRGLCQRVLLDQGLWRWVLLGWGHFRRVLWCRVLYRRVLWWQGHISQVATKSMGNGSYKRRTIMTWCTWYLYVSWWLIVSILVVCD